MNTNIYLVRHAHSSYTLDELNRPLSEKGFRDAKIISKILLNEDIERSINKMTDRIDKLIANFQLRNIEVICVDTSECVKNEILNLVPINESVGIGHSETLQKMDITNTLKDRGNTVFDKELTKDKEECKVLKKKALLADWYITGSNAISVDGRIVNVDHSGNRVAAIIEGQSIKGRIKVFIVNENLGF